MNFIVALIVALTTPPPVFLPFISTAPVSATCTQAGKPFTDAVLYRGALVISRQDGTLFRDCVAWMQLTVNATGERGLNALATDGRRLWAGYVSTQGRITVAEITSGAPAVVADFGVAGTKHNAAGMIYDNGVLLFGIGDNETPANAQRDDSPAGKIFAISPETGERSIVAKGLRNPWHIVRIANVIYISDVGETKYEEVNVLQAGSNYGWPCYEGNERRLYDCGHGANVVPATVAPVVMYGRETGRGVVGVAQIGGAMVYADFAGDVRTFDGALVRHVAGMVSKLTMASGMPVVLSFAGGVARAEVQQ